MQNPSIGEVNDPQVRSKLEGFQESVADIAREMEKLDDAIERKKGVVEGCATLANRVRDECKSTMNLVDKEEMDPEEAKIRNDQTMKIVQLLSEIGERNTRDLVVMEGRREGLSQSCDVIEKRFYTEAGKYERWIRIEQEEEAEKDDMQTPPEEQAAEQATEQESDGEEKSEGKKGSRKKPKK